MPSVFPLLLHYFLSPTNSARQLQLKGAGGEGARAAGRARGRPRARAQAPPGAPGAKSGSRRAGSPSGWEAEWCEPGLALLPEEALPSATKGGTCRGDDADLRPLRPAHPPKCSGWLPRVTSLLTGGCSGWKLIPRISSPADSRGSDRTPASTPVLFRPTDCPERVSFPLHHCCRHSALLCLQVDASILGKPRATLRGGGGSQEEGVALWGLSGSSHKQHNQLHYGPMSTSASRRAPSGHDGQRQTTCWELEAGPPLSRGGSLARG